MIYLIIILSFLLLCSLSFTLFVLLDNRKILIEKKIANQERDSMLKEYNRLNIQISHLNAEPKGHIIYVVGFAFNHDRTKVMLIVKNKPIWQAGKLNGLGGKVKYSETQFVAMQRKFVQECGIITTQHEWKQFACIVGDDYLLYCLTTQLGKYSQPAIALPEDEQASWYPVREVIDRTDPNIIHNVPWLVSMALDEQVQMSNIKA